MSRLNKTIKAVSRILQYPWILNKVLEEETPWKDLVRRKYGMEQGFPIVRPELVFSDFSETITPFTYLDGGSLPTDLALLKKLAGGFPKCAYFEIGTWRGESAANVAQVAAECVTLNLSGEEMAHRNMEPDYIRQHGMFSRQLPNVQHLEGNTLNFDFSSLKRKFDLIFIDGDHRYDMVVNDTRKVFEHLAHEKSVIVWHDYARNQESVRFEVLAGILEGCPGHFHKNIRHVAHTLCAVLFPYDIPGLPPSTLKTPVGHFTIRLDFIRTGP